MGSIGNFEWDDKKAAKNYTKHSVSFKEAMNVFRDPFAIGELDDWEAYGEERFILVGMAGNRLLNVVYTERGGRIRIISSRKATKRERENYNRQNAR